MFHMIPLRSNDSPYVQSQPLKGLEDIKVYELIEPVTKTWCYDILDQNFNESDAKAIRAMPMHFDAWDDKLIWTYSRNVRYSVKLAYYQAMKTLIDNFELRCDVMESGIEFGHFIFPIKSRFFFGGFFAITCEPELA